MDPRGALSLIVRSPHRSSVGLPPPEKDASAIAAEAEKLQRCHHAELPPREERQGAMPGGNCSSANTIALRLGSPGRRRAYFST